MVLKDQKIKKYSTDCALFIMNHLILPKASSASTAAPCCRRRFAPPQMPHSCYRLAPKALRFCCSVTSSPSTATTHRKATDWPLPTCQTAYAALRSSQRRGLPMTRGCHVRRKETYKPCSWPVATTSVP